MRRGSAQAPGCTQGAQGLPGWALEETAHVARAEQAVALQGGRSARPSPGPCRGAGVGGVLEQSRAVLLPRWEHQSPQREEGLAQAPTVSPGQGDIVALPEERVGDEEVPRSFQTTLKLSHREVPSGVAHGVQVTSSAQESRVQPEASVTAVASRSRRSLCLTGKRTEAQRARPLGHSCTAG